MCLCFVHKMMMCGGQVFSVPATIDPSVPDSDLGPGPHHRGAADKKIMKLDPLWL